jgi:DNA-binding response OmpR family regulator
MSRSKNSDNYGSAKVGQSIQPKSRQSLQGRRWYDGLKVPRTRKIGVIHYGPLVLDNDRKTVRVDGEARTVAPKLFELLRVFMSNPGKVLSHAELAVSLWPDDDRADPDDVKQHIYLLRKAIETDPVHPQWIKNLRGFGYQLNITS